MVLFLRVDHPSPLSQGWSAVMAFRLCICIKSPKYISRVSSHLYSNQPDFEINKRGESVEEKIKRLDGELAKYKEQIKRTRPGPAQEAVKARAMRILKQKRMYEGQRDMLYNQTFNLDQVAFASEGIKDAQQTMSALKSANKELKGMMKTVKIQEIDNLQEDMMDLMEVSNEIQESLGRSYNVPDDIDEEDLMGGCM